MSFLQELRTDRQTDRDMKSNGFLLAADRMHYVLSGSKSKGSCCTGLGWSLLIGRDPRAGCLLKEYFCRDMDGDEKREVTSASILVRPRTPGT